MAGKVLKTTVTVNTTQALTALKKLEKQINRVQAAIDKTSGITLKLNATLDKVVTKSSKLDKANKKAAQSAAKITKHYRESSSVLDTLSTKVKRLAGTYLGLMGAKMAVEVSDTITGARNRMNNYTGGDVDLTNSSMDKMYASAQKTRMGYADMMANVGKSMTLASKAFGDNIDNAIRFQEIMAESYAIGGASDAEMASSMYQLMQALGSGTLQGDELRSVREGAPVAFREIEKFAQGLYQTEESLKDLASEGKITSEIVVAAMMNAGDSIDQAFSGMDKTFGQTWTNIKNTAIGAFQPVLDYITNTFNGTANQAIINGIGNVFMFIANVVNNVLQMIGGVVKFISDNWKIVSTIIKLAGTALGVYLATKVAILGKKLSITLGKSIYLTLTNIADWWEWVRVMGFAAAMEAKLGIALSTWQWAAIGVFGILIACVLLFSDSLQDAIGILSGSIVTALAATLNVIIGTINAILQAIWTAVTPILDIVEFCLNAFNGGFNSFGDMVANLIGNIIAWFVGLGKVVTTIVDAIFGTDWTSGLESLQNSLRQWGKNENAITIDRNAPVLNRISYEDAWNLGYGLFGGAEDISTLPDATMPEYMLNTSLINPTLANIADDTADISKSMKMADEDLEYLRKLADAEWKKEYTTAEIKIDMSNYNTINSDSDLDGIVTKLTDKLYDELNYMANGVYE